MSTSHAAGDASGILGWPRPRSARCPWAFLSSAGTEPPHTLPEQSVHGGGAGNGLRRDGPGETCLPEGHALRASRPASPPRAPLEPEQLRDALLVGGRELVLVELLGAHPAMGVDAHVLDRPRHEPAAIH